MNERPERLVEGLDAARQAELGDLSSVEDLLASYPAPDPSPFDSARLLANLEPFLADKGKAEARFTLVHWVQLARSQAVLIERPFWLASALVFLMGLAMALLDGEGTLTVLFVFLSPAAAAAGVAYAFRPATRTLWELEKLTPTHPLELLYTRLALVMCFNSVLALLLLAIAWWQGPQVVLWRVLLAWLGPMLALAGMALYGTVRWGSVAGILAAMGAWGTVISFGWWRALAEVTLVERPLWLLEQINQSNGLVLFFLAALVCGVWLLSAAGRWVQQSDTAWS
jgi:hypothetical protein